MKYKCPVCGKSSDMMYCDTCGKAIPKSCEVDEPGIHEEQEKKASDAMQRENRELLRRIERNTRIVAIIALVYAICSVIYGIYLGANIASILH